MSTLSDIFSGGLDLSKVEPQGDCNVIPPGKYPVMIEKAEVKPTKAGTGAYIELVLCILEGPYKNRKLWHRLNIKNPSELCVSIGLSTLRALCDAIGITVLGSEDQLVNKTCLAHVKVDKNGQNDVRTYSAATPLTAPPSAPTPVAPVSPQQPQPGQPAAGNQPHAIKPPWER